MNTYETLKHIQENKRKYVKERKYEEAAKWRQKEVDFMKQNFNIDIREIILPENIDEDIDPNLFLKTFNEFIRRANKK